MNLQPKCQGLPIVVLGEALMDCIALPNDASVFKPHLGGSPYNVARAVAKQGGAVWFLNPLSNDDFGQQLASQHRADGVHVGLANNNLPTSLAMVSFLNGQPSYQFYREGVADRGFDRDQALSFLASFPKPGILHTGSLALVPPEAAKTLAILNAAKSMGWFISVDVNVRMRLAQDPRSYRQVLLAFIKIADWIKLSDEDLEHILQNSEVHIPGLSLDQISYELAPQMATSIAALGPQRIALTFGGLGALIQDESSQAQGPAPSVKVADTVGAGDTFWGTCLRLWAGHLQSAPEVLQIALVAAAYNCQFAGCTPPSLGDLI